MTKQELINILSELADSRQDAEAAHIEADEALLKYINDTKITLSFEKINKWYS